MRYEGLNTEALKKALWGKREEVAELLGITPTSLSRKVNGRQRIFVDELVSIARYLKKNLHTFIKA